MCNLKNVILFVYIVLTITLHNQIQTAIFQITLKIKWRF